MVDPRDSRVEEAAYRVFRSRLRMAVYEQREMTGEIMDWERALHAKHLSSLTVLIRELDPTSDVVLRRILLKAASDAVGSLVDEDWDPTLADHLLDTYKAFDLTALINEARRPRSD